MKKITLIPVLVVASAFAVPATSMAGVTGNIGFATDYVFRGIQQAESSAYAGADYAGENGFYAGTWWADVGAGTETDLYAGWSGGNDNVTYKIGYTGYRYLDDFDGDYDELNLGLYAGIFALDIAVGTYDPLFSTQDQDYIFTSVTLTPEKGPYYKLGIWGGDFADNILPLVNAGKKGDDSGEYLEVGYAYTMEESGIVLSATLVYSDQLPVSASLTSDYSLAFGIKKNFEMK